MFKKIYNIADQGIICDLGNEINKEISIKTIAIFNYINKISINNLKLGIKNITPSYNKIVIQYDLTFSTSEIIIKFISSIKEKELFYSNLKKIIEIPICYDREYGIDLKDSVNAIIVKTKTGELKYAACALLATTRLDINKTIRKKLGARKVSFADIEETVELTEMNIGGVTPLVLPNTLPLWVDSKVMQRNSIVLGGGNRSSKIIISPKIFNYTSNTEIVDGLAY